jgi:hypothetical protein
MHLERWLLPLLYACALACGQKSGNLTKDTLAAQNSVANGATPNGETGNAATTDYVRLHYVRIMDNSGFGQPVEAARFLVPVGWRSEGGISWTSNLGCLYMLVNAQFRFVAPDGITALEVFPTYAWNWYDDPYQRQVASQTPMGGSKPCDLAPPAGAVDFLRGKLVPAFRRGAQIVGSEAQPQVAAASQRSLQAYMQQAAAYGIQMQLRADAARVRLNYTMNGQPVEEWITATVQSNRTMGPSATAAMQGGMGQSATYVMVTTAQIGTRAPAGRLDAMGPLFATMIASYRPNLAWSNAVSQVLGNMNNTASQGAMDRSRIWAEANRSISETIRQGYDYQQQSQDRIAESWSQTTRGVETFVDPSTHERVELSSGYSQVWSNGQGEYILSNTPNFEPGREIQGNWREMQRPQH